MIRFVFRMLAMLSLAIAVIFAVLDAGRSIAASELVATPLGTSWLEASPQTLEAARAWMSGTLAPQAWDLGAVFVLSLPGFVVFAALALVFYALGRRPSRRAGRFAPET
jgi:hypothetical protein